MERDESHVAGEEQLQFEGLGREQNRRVREVARIVLNDRDVEMLRFVFEMKFADLQALHRKFFAVLRTGASAKSDWYARDRVRALAKSGLLKQIQMFAHRVPFYLLTRKGYLVIRDLRPDDKLPNYNDSIDVRTFEHDRKVLSARLALEAMKEVTYWQSERKLRSDLSVGNVLPKDYQPDAIYISSSGEKVAFELEISQKSRSRYQEKIKRYVNLIRSGRSSAAPFERAVFWCDSKTVFGILSQEAKLYGSMIQVRAFTELQGQ